MKKDPLIFIKHIKESIMNIEDFSKNLSKEEFIKNRLKQSAIIREIGIIGEAVKNIPAFFRNKYQEIPWSKIAGTRDKITHHYFGLDLDTVWEIIKKDLPDLKKKIKKILDDFK